MKTTRRLESFVRWGIVALGAYLLVAAVALFWHMGRVREAQEWVAQSQRVRYAVQDILSLTLDAESSQRAYALVQSDEYLKDHDSAVTRLRTAADSLKAQTRDNPLQLDRAIGLERLIATKIEQMQAAIDFTRKVDQTKAVENYRSGATQSVAHDIRQTIQALLDEEDRLFALRRDDVARMERVRVVTFALLLALFAGVSGIYFKAANRNIATRNAMLAQLSDAKAKSERADRFKGDLLNHLGRAIHDPLTSITSQSDLLLYRATDALSEKDQRMVAEIRKTARELLALASNFLHIGRLQARKPLNLDEDDCDLDDIFQLALSPLNEKAARAGVDMRSTKAFTRAFIRCDKLKLKQILGNLLDNAIANTPPGGHVELSARAAATGEMVIAVRDTGRGIPPDRLKQVMVPFAEMDNMFEREAQGIGLGLLLAVGLAQAHGGTLELVSGADGTLAEVTLPAYRVIKIFEGETIRRAS